MKVGDKLYPKGLRIQFLQGAILFLHRQKEVIFTLDPILQVVVIVEVVIVIELMLLGGPFGFQTLRVVW